MRFGNMVTKTSNARFFIFSTPHAKEAELVNEELLNDIACYNLKLGGLGGITKDARRKGVETLKHRLRTEESFKENMLQLRVAI